MVVHYFRNKALYSFYLDYSIYTGMPIQQLRIVKTGKDAAEKEFIIPVKRLDGFTIKINKKSIAAQDGASGLFNFIAGCIKNDFMMLYVNKIIEQFC